MRTNKIFYGAIGLMTLGLAACSNDDVLKGYEIETVDADQTRYISVQISAPNDATRADEFQDGTTNESYVRRLDFLFYDAAGNPTSAPQSLTNLSETNFTNLNEDGNVTRLYTSVVPVQLVQGQNLPSQVICIVNGNAANVETLKTVPLADLIDVQRDYFRVNNDFLMSNSVYYGQNVLTGEPNQRLCATPINANMQLFGTEQEATNAIKNQETNPGALVDIYVERLAAKVGLVMSEEAPKPYELANGEPDATNDKVTLTFKAEYWAMNATPTDSYLTKRYGVDMGTSGINLLPTYDEINNALSTLGGFTTWNDEPNHRSYWGCSPSYFVNKYPYVSDDVTDDDEYPLNYYSYAKIKYQANRTDAGDFGISKQALAAASNGSFSTTNSGDHTTGYIYTRESTVALSTIRNIESGNPGAAVASAVIVGKYTANVPDAPATFYVDRNSNNEGIYYSKEATVKSVLTERQFIVFTDNKGQNSAAADVFTLAHPSVAVQQIAKVNLAGRLVTLQVDETKLSAENKLYYYDAAYIPENAPAGTEPGAYVEVTAANINAVNAQLLSVGYMDMYHDGLAFFSVPIRHLNWKKEYYVTSWTEKVEDPVTGEITEVTHEYPVGRYDWKNMETGALGVVRNHVYNLTINTITGLGSALASDDQPIVPPKEDNNQYVAARINVLAWKIANEWSVDL